MKITVYSMKGGVGKTPIATNIALELGYALGTNEPFNMLDHVIPEDSLMTIQPEETFPKFPDDVNVVFDLAGIISNSATPSIQSAVLQSDVILVPICNENKALHGGVHTIAGIEPLNSKIVVVATKLVKQKGEAFTDWSDSREFKNIKAYVEARTGSSYPMLPLKLSKAYDSIFEDDMSIRSVMDANPLRRLNYREVDQQFSALLKFLEKYDA